MDLRRLGKTDIELTPIGLGTWQFQRSSGMMGGFWTDIGQEGINEVVRVARAGGISWFDTAEMYGNGASERSLAAALAALGAAPGSVRIATKWWPFPRFAGQAESSIGARLECLSPYPIDLYQVHWPLSFSSVAGQMRVFARLLKAGKIKAVGVSNFSAKAMEKAHAALAAEGIALASNQVRINLLDRSIESNGILAAAKRLGISLIAYSPLAQGVLTGRFHDDPAQASAVSGMRRSYSKLGNTALERSAPVVRELKAIAAAHGATPAMTALAWILAFYGPILFAIPGATKPAQAEQNAGARGLSLSAKELSALDEASRKSAAGSIRPAKE